MFVSALSLRNIRNYERLDIELGPGINLFYGANAQGKTNLLEALCYLASLRSFRGARAADIVAWGGKEGRVAGLILHGSRPEGCGRADGCGQAEKGGHGKRAVAAGASGAQKDTAAGGKAPGGRTRLAVGITGGRRRVAVDGKRPENAARYLRALKVASFSPEDLFLAREYPSHRRRFLDRSIFHLHPDYLGLANDYRRALGQLNAALKGTGGRADRPAKAEGAAKALRPEGRGGGGSDPALVDALEELFAPLAAAVAVKRREQAELLGARAARIYRGVLGGGELKVSYRSPVSGGTEKELAAAYGERLAAKRAEALRRGHCQVGPHTEDLQLTLDGRDMRVSASRGQSRLAMMALVLADCGLYAEERGSFPVLLLDDVGSELDDARRAALMECVSGMGQALLSATGRELAPPGALVFRVGDGSVRPG